ncbi:sensor histidine kinase [Leekyejoonella antrihumi]|uniref:ATP-binding protein n=1 Tax=Leekyejoonella antrihumi TaxID=1660198 RepID=A0A563DSE9_9MICO|nr:ATP-binding protein [Leekyejoonella antrihumi]TWP32862.1 ATP-binding protein [Leekyejoonella antrihumi]
MADRLSLDELGKVADLREIVLRHAYRGVWVQLGLRALLVVFMVLTIGFVPPGHDRPACWLIVAGYAVWASALAWWTRRGGLGPVQWMWLALLVDAAAIAALTLVAGLAAEQSWTADVLINGFFVVPMLAATSLRPAICAAVAAPTVAAELAVSILTQDANAEPWASILLRFLIIAGLAAGSVALSRVQLSRVLTIGQLARERTDLLTEIVGIEARERALLAEQLHDGALQYLLAARQDLDEARTTGDPDAFARVALALRESSAMLRSTVSELHPAVLEQAGFARALTDLATGVARRGRFAAQVDLSGWPDRPTSADLVLFGAAREALNNVVKHARARTVTVTLRLDGSAALLAVVDDGRGIPDGLLDRRVAEGHIGLASHRARIAAAGGELQIEPGASAGTRISVRLPLDPHLSEPAERPIRR